MRGRLPGVLGLAAAIAATAWGPPPASAQQGARPVTIHQCVSEAMRQNPAVKQAEWGTAASVAATDSVRGGFGPVVSADGNVMRWDEPTKANFGGGGGGFDPSMLPEPATPYEMIVKELVSGFSGGTEIQKQVTWQVSATVAQPLTPLWTVYKAHELSNLGIDVARLKEVETRNSTAMAVVDSYYGHLQARSVWLAMQASIKRVSAALDKVVKLKEAELVGRGDVLKVQVALAGVKQAEVQTRNIVELTRASLATQVGWGATVELEPADITRELPPASVGSLDEALAAATRQRVELAALRKQLGQAALAEDLVWSEYIPTVVALGTFTHAEGNSFRDEDSWFVGATLNWKLFEWGRTWYRVDEARARQRQLQSASEMVVNFIQLEVKKAWLDYSASVEVLAAAGVRVSEAEENFRVQKKLYEAEYKTSTDLLDAEAALTEATAQRAVAFYKVWAAKAALGKAVGEPVESWLPPDNTSAMSSR